MLIGEASSIIVRRQSLDARVSEEVQKTVPGRSGYDEPPYLLTPSITYEIVDELRHGYADTQIEE